MRFICFCVLLFLSITAQASHLSIFKRSAGASTNSGGTSSPDDCEKVRRTQSSLNQTEKDLIVKIHNDLRSATAKLKNVASMQKMEWSDELAKQAQALTDKCVHAHGMTRSCVDESPLGQNLWSLDVVGRRVLIMNDILRDFIKEGEWYDEKTMSCTPPTWAAGQGCGHYTQIVWEDTTKVGCGKTYCHLGGDNYKYLFVCDYSPSGNIHSVNPFTFGPPCSKCKAKQEIGAGIRCNRNFCEHCKVGIDQNCKCVLKCEWGDLDPATCTCACQTKKTGLRCQRNCGDIWGAVRCQSLKTHCTGRMAELFKINCAETCGYPDAKC